MTLSIIILAMIAAFLGLRLYSVLGDRAEHEEEPMAPRPRTDQRDEAATQLRPATTVRSASQPQTAIADREFAAFPPGVERGLRAIAAADRRFDPIAFLEGAKGAYTMVLEAFWRGDKEELRELCDDDVYASFAGAIDAREKAGEKLDNKLIRIEETRIHSASMDVRTARIAILFVADIASVTRDKDGNVIAGSLDDAIESRDIWTFSRNVSSSDPNWVLDETDEG